MLNRPSQVHLSESYRQKSSQLNVYNDQHGLQDLGFVPILPSESITHITSFLDPQSLLALSRVNKALYEHVKDDNTWHRAFLCQFLGISPESDLDDDNVRMRSLMLRRVENTWRKEFLTRFHLKRRWESSRNSTVTHTPHHSPISSMHLMSSHEPAAILSSSLQYGIVSRSLPLTGKILRGYLDASGTGLGVGNNNPNVEFTPNISACAMSSEGGTAKIIWGFRNGEIALMTAQKAMAMDGGGRAGATAAKLVRCKAEDEHEGAVLDVVWHSSSSFVTSGSDGRVKLWDAKKVRCVWTSEKKEGILVDPIVKATSGTWGKDTIIVGAKASGDIVVYSGLKSCLSEEVSPTTSVTEVRIPCSVLIGTSPNSSGVSHDILALHLSPSCILAGYKSYPFFHKLEISLASNSFDWTQYGNASSPVCSILPSFTEKEGEESFVITGDQLGIISIYPWDTSPDQHHDAIYKFNAHIAPITAIAQSSDSVALVTGSADGEIKVWDSLSFTPIRSFAFAAPRLLGGAPAEVEMIRQIIVEREMMIATAGEQVMAWRAGNVSVPGKHHRPGKTKLGASGGKGKGQRGHNKYRQQLEIKQHIAELDPELDRVQTFVHRAHGREREQRSELDRLGLDELEAVEYVLMLSRDEEEIRCRSGVGSIPSQLDEEGVFEGNVDESPASSSFLSRNCVTPTSSGSDSPSSLSWRSLSTSNSSSKIQVSPRVRPEAIEAGTGSLTITSPLTRIPGLDEFPPIGVTSSTAINSTSTNRSGSQWRSATRTTQGSWPTPLTAPISGSAAIRSGSSLLTADLARYSTNIFRTADDEDLN